MGNTIHRYNISKIQDSEREIELLKKDIQSLEKFKEKE